MEKHKLSFTFATILTVYMKKYSVCCIMKDFNWYPKLGLIQVVKNIFEK